METTILSINLISSNPNVRSGRPVIDGTGICVSDIVAAVRFHNMTPETILEDAYPELTLAQVHAALAYYYEHQTDIDDDMTKRDQIATEMKEKRVGSRHPPLF